MDRETIRSRAGIGTLLLVLAVILFALVTFGATIFGMGALEQVAAGLALATLARVVP